jgi:hypothetical protein
MELQTRLMRLEITFEGNAVSGAQATVEDGILDGDGRWVRVRERTFGLDTGRHPEYAAPLDHALGLAAGQALAANRGLASQLTERDETIDKLREDNTALSAECDRLAAAGEELARDRDRLAAFLDSLTRKSDELAVKLAENLAA